MASVSQTESVSNATSVEPRISWLRPSSINRAHTRTPPGSILGTTQSFSAQAVKPPVLRRYTRPLFLWGFGIFFAVFWGSAGLRAIARNPGSLGTVEGPIGFLVCFGLICFAGMILSFRKIARYNREIYPSLQWNWEHTYICRRCGRLRLIPS